MHEIHGDQDCLGEGERNQEPDFDNRREPHGVDQQFDRGQDRQINENCYVVGLGVCFVSLMCYRLSRHSFYRSPPCRSCQPAYLLEILARCEIDSPSPLGGDRIEFARLNFETHCLSLVLRECRGAHHSPQIKYTNVKIRIQTRSTKCQYRPATSTNRASTTVKGR